MKQFFTTSILILLFSYLSGQNVNQAFTAKKMTFLGLDYTGAVFIGYKGFKDPTALQLLPDAWNSLFVSEPDKYNIQKAFNTRVEYDLNIVKERNSTINYAERITEKSINLPHLTKDDLQAMINTYPDLKEGEVAMVFIVDAYDKLTAKGYYHIVFYQVETKKILLVYAVSGDAGGGGLRNYWAHSFYDAIINAGKRYSATAEFYRNYTE